MDQAPESSEVVSRPYQQALSEQLGPSYGDIPDKYRYSSAQNPIPKDILAQTTPDHIAGLPIMNDPLRKHVIDRSTELIRQGKTVAIFEVDSDQLKAANNISRRFGDETILSGTATACQAISAADVSCEHYIVRPQGSPDESLAIFFDPSPEDLKKIKALHRTASTVRRISVKNLKGQPVDFPLGCSSSVITSEDARVGSQLAETKHKLLTGEITNAAGFFGLMSDFADAATKGVKAIHELQNMHPKELLQLNLREFEDKIVKEMGGMRISGAGLRLILRMNSIITFKTSGEYPADARQDIPEIDTDLIDQASIETLRDVVDVYNSLFGHRETPKPPPANLQTA